MALILGAVDVAAAHHANGVSEAHLVHSVLERSRPLVRLLEELEVPVSVVRGHIGTQLGVDSPPAIDVVERADGGRELYRYGMLDLIEGRTMVLAATRERHAVDAIDVFVSALFDPHSLTTHATSVVAGVDRVGLLEEVSQRLSRYQGVAFPPSRVATLEARGRVLGRDARKHTAS